MYDKTKVIFKWVQVPTTGQKDVAMTLTFNNAYQQYATQWEENYACYKGMSAIISAGLVGKHPRESEENWAYREAKLCSPNYTRAVEDAYTAHLTRKQGTVFPGVLEANVLFNLFLEDADYNGSKFLDIFTQESSFCGVLGGIGYLVDMPAFDIATNMSILEASEKKIYPYVSIYYPPNILDWQYIRDEWGRPILVFLKLLDDDGYIRCWWDMGDEIKWEVYQSDINVLSAAAVGENTIYRIQAHSLTLSSTPRKISEGGTNKIKYIPFTFAPNKKSGIRMIGESDVTDIARLDVRIIDNLARIGEIADIAAFPILLLPKERSGEAPAERAIGPSATLPIDPISGITPQWLKAEVAEPIRALWEDNEKIIEEIYRVALFGGMDQMNGGNNTGPALNIKYQQLGARLAEKAHFQEQAGNMILYHWQSWLGLEIDEQAKIQMPHDYNVEDLAADIDQAIKSSNFVAAEAFRREMRKAISNKMLPNLPIDVQKEISDEITETSEQIEQEKRVAAEMPPIDNIEE